MNNTLIHLGITAANYNYLMGATGILCGFIFALVIIGVIIKL